MQKGLALSLVLFSCTNGQVIFEGCSAPYKLQVDIAVSDFLDDCFIPLGKDGLVKALGVIEANFPGSVFSLHRYTDFSEQSGNCFETFATHLPAKAVSIVLQEKWADVNCDLHRVISDAQYIETYGSIDNLLATHSVAWWNRTNLADASLNVLTYLSNIPRKSSEFLHIPIVITPKLPHYETDPSNIQVGENTQTDHIPSKDSFLRSCQSLQYVSFAMVKNGFAKNEAVPGVLHTYDDPATKQLNVAKGWKMTMNTLGYGVSSQNVQKVNPFGDRLEERFIQLLSNICQIIHIASTEVNTTASSESKSSGSIDMSNAVLASVGVASVLGMLGMAVWESWRRFREDEDMASFSDSGSERDVDETVTQTRAMGFEEAF